MATPADAEAALNAAGISIHDLHDAQVATDAVVLVRSTFNWTFEEAVWTLQVLRDLSDEMKAGL